MTNPPPHDPQTEQLHGRPAALKRLLESAVPSAFPSVPDLEKTIQGIAGHIDTGLCRVYAVHINECRDEEGCKRLLERASRRIDNPQLIEQLKATLVESAQQRLVPLLADVALESIDHILQQAKALGHEGSFLHVQYTRMGNELIVLADRDPRYEWILPAVQKRLREELSNLHYDPADIETQALDLALGHQLRFLDYELRLAKDRHGETRVRYRLVAKSNRRQVKNAVSSWRLLGQFQTLRFAHPYLNWIGGQGICQIVQASCRHMNSIQVGWRHLPITLYPVVVFLFGWQSLAAWFCLAAIFISNWRRTLRIVMSSGGWVRRHKLDATIGACILACLIYLYPLAAEYYENLSREEAASFMPPGFYLGQYNKDSPWGSELVPYGLYVPPHFQHEKGPSPLIVYLHGYGERTKARLFKAGLPLSIAHSFGPNKPNGSFEFVAFFPIDSTGNWKTGSAEVEDAMIVLDYVIRRHHIDPARVYLSGISNGGMGVWRLAMAYPDKWAAVVPVSSFISPDVEKVRHIPTWIFHAAKDEEAAVERERDLVKQLKEAKADVRYTEFPDSGHEIWRQTYEHKELYTWLATKRKD